jgi:hypothetical protein
MQPWQDRNLARSDQVGGFQVLRRDDPLPHGIGKGIRELQREVVSDRGGGIEKMPTVLMMEIVPSSVELSVAVR